ncbi:MAG: hypothetical protein K2N42_03195, partial [Anaeroplasmataceae bacterium]|nr:hypothetical protein [Anaeroplasmataceae bacterium]
MKKSFYINAVGFVCGILLSLVSWAIIPMVCSGIKPNENSINWVGYIIVFILASVMGVFYLIIGIVFWGAKISFDEKGVHKSVLGKFFKKDVLWDELCAIKLYPTRDKAVSWLVFSKVDLANIDWKGTFTIKDKIILLYNINIIKCIK